MCTLYLWILTSKFVYWSFNYLKYNLQHITTSKWCLDMIYSFWKLEKLMKCRSKYFHLFIQLSPSVMSDSLWPHGLQLSRLPWPSPTPISYSNSCPSHWWSHPTNSSSVVPFFPCLQSFPASASFPIEFVLHIRWPKYWSFSFSISLSNEYSGLISFRMTGWISLQFKVLSRVFNTTVQQHPFFSA